MVPTSLGYATISGVPVQYGLYAAAVGLIAFALFTICNLAPRAISNHAWYRRKFTGYPRERRALIPGLF